MREGNGQVALGDSAERMTVPVALMQQHPLAPLFTGGEGALHTSGRQRRCRRARF